MLPSAGRRLKGSGCFVLVGLAATLAACGSGANAAGGHHLSTSTTTSTSRRAEARRAALDNVMQKAIDDARAERSFHYRSAEYVAVSKDGPEHVTSTGNVGLSEGRETIDWRAGTQSGVATVELVDGVVYLESASASMLLAYFGLPSAVAKADAGRWLSASPRQDASGFAALSTGLTVNAVIRGLGIAGPYTNRGVDISGGVELRKVTGSMSGIGGTRIPVVFNVDLARRPLLVGGILHVDGGQGKSSFSWSIDHFGEKISVQRPH